MSRWKLRIEERAEGEAREAFLWYRARNPVAAELFQAAVEECIDRIAAEPETFPVFEDNTRRRLIFHRFPYGVVYRVVEEEVQIIAVAHLRRRPGYWRR